MVSRERLERGGASAGTGMGRRLTLGRFRGVLFGEDQQELEETALPQGLLLPGNATLPLLQVEYARAQSLGPSEEAKGVIFAPELSVQLLVYETLLA